MAKARNQPTVRERSQRQARENRDDARATRQSHRPGVDDDSEIVQSLVSTLAAPVEGTLDSMRERERRAERGQDIGPDHVGGISGQRGEDIPNVDADGERRAQVPRRPEDAEAEPTDIAEDMTRDRPGATAKR
jgi:hypothetical protein